LCSPEHQKPKDEEMTETLSEQLADYRANWRARVPADRQALMDQHVAHLAASGIDRSARQVGDRAPPIRLRDQHGQTLDVATLLAKGPVVVTFYRGGWCPFCNLELNAYQAILPRIAAAGASIVAISPEKPDDTVTTAETNALSFPVLSDVGQATGRAFGVVYAFTDEVRQVYEGFKLDVPAKNGTADDWSLPLSATYVIGMDGGILFADTRVDYRERTDPFEVLRVLEHRAAAE
jgi:peroxiredoxin